MMETKKRTDTGYTLIELLVVLAIVGLVFAAIWATFRFQQQSYSLQRQMVAMEQNLRAAMIMMEKEIRMARINEQDILAEKIVSDKGRLGLLVNKATGVITDDIDWSHEKGKDDPNEPLIFTGI